MHEVRLFIRELVEKFGKTVFLSSHLLGEVEQICDRVAIIHMGQIVREGPVRDLLAAVPQLRVEASPLDKAAAVLQEHWKLSTNGQWLTVAATREDTPQIVRRLVENGIEVYEVASQRQTLEEYFLSVVQGGVGYV
jgi:ABC-2 type transport system ATP-binding protein